MPDTFPTLDEWLDKIDRHAQLRYGRPMTRRERARLTEVYPVFEAQWHTLIKVRDTLVQTAKRVQAGDFEGLLADLKS